MRELRAGGLAIIVKTFRHPEYIGKTVTLLRIVSSGEAFLSPTTNHKCRSIGGDGWICAGDICDKSYPSEYGWGTFKPEQLMPIDGEDFSHERTEEYCHVYGH